MVVASLYTFHIAPLHLLLTDPTHMQRRLGRHQRLASDLQPLQGSRQGSRPGRRRHRRWRRVASLPGTSLSIASVHVPFTSIIYLLTCVYDCTYFYRRPTPIYTSYLPCRLLPHHSLTCFRTSVAVAVANEHLIRVVTHLLPSSSRLLFSLDPDLHHHHLHICIFSCLLMCCRRTSCFELRNGRSSTALSVYLRNRGMSDGLNGYAPS